MICTTTTTTTKFLQFGVIKVLGRAGPGQIHFSTAPVSNALWNFGKSKKSSADSNMPDPSSTSSGVQGSGVGSSEILTRGPLPLITSRKLPHCPPHRPPRQAWVENLDTQDEQKLGLVDLHPEIWARFPRIDIVHDNLTWQLMYKKVNWAWTPTRAEMKGSGRKPWPQKGTGRARHGSLRSPLFLNGAKAHGPRGPKTYYYMLPDSVRILGLCTTLSMKLAQDDVKIVDSLDIPSQEPQYLEELAVKRAWGMSVLFVDDTDLMPLSISLATETLGYLNLMPVYGLNVHSLLKHETLVLTTAALDLLESKLLFHLHKNDSYAWSVKKPKPNHVDLLGLSGGGTTLPKTSTNQSRF